MRRLSGLFVALLFTVALDAQTPSFKLQWDQPEGVSAAQGYIYTLKVDTGAATTLTQTCAAAPAPSTAARCTAPLPALASGPHTLQLSVFSAGGSASADPVTTAPPAKPLTVTITITITIP